MTPRYYDSWTMDAAAIDDVERDEQEERGSWEEEEFDSNLCNCGSGEPKYAEYDGNGIFITYVCDECRAEKIRGYRPEILDGPYTQADVDEQIEPEAF